MPLAVRPVEGLVGEQHALLGAHRHLAPQYFFVVFVADGNDRDVAADPGSDLQTLLRRRSCPIH